MKGVSKAYKVLGANFYKSASGAINIRDEEKGDGDDDWHDKSNALGVRGSHIEANHQVATNSDGPH